MPKIIYFIKGCPTEEQREEARIMQAVFRDPDAVGREGDFFEECEAVCGERIPDEYAHKPVAECSVDRRDMLKSKDKPVGKPAAKSTGRTKAAKKSGE